MEERQDRMPVEHPWARVPHDGLDLLPDLRLIAVNRAFDAGRFGFLKRAALQPDGRVVKQRAAFDAQIPARAVNALAETGDHGRDRPAFPLQPTMGKGHRARKT